MALEPLFLADATNISLVDGGAIAVLGTIAGILWRRVVQLEERSHIEGVASVRALGESAGALKDNAKTTERQAARIEELVSQVRALTDEVRRLRGA